MQKYEAIIFDMDGTLVDTGALIGESFRHTITQVFDGNRDLSELTALVGIPLKQQMEFFGQKYFNERNERYKKYTAPDDLVAELLEIYRTHCDEVHDDFIASFDGIEEFLISLNERSLPIAVATSKRHHTAVADLDHFNLYRYFDGLIGSDDVAEHKPKPMPLIAAMNLLSEKHQRALAPESCIYIGDSPYDIQAAKAAGMLSVGVEYGMFDRSKLEAERPDMLLATPANLNELLKLI